MGFPDLLRWRRRGPRAERRFRTPLTRHQLWMVALGAPAAWDAGPSRTTLYPLARLDDDGVRRRLAEEWGIRGRQDLVARLDGLSRTGDRARAQRMLGVAPLAWDAAQYVEISRRAFAAGLISEADAWTALKNIVPSVARTYASWHEYGEHYLLGRGLGRSGLPDLAFPGEDEVRALLDPENRASPWNVVPWDTIYDPDRPR